MANWRIRPPLANQRMRAFEMLPPVSSIYLSSLVLAQTGCQLTKTRRAGRLSLAASQPASQPARRLCRRQSWLPSDLIISSQNKHFKLDCLLDFERQKPPLPSEQLQLSFPSRGLHSAASWLALSISRQPRCSDQSRCSEEAQNKSPLTRTYLVLAQIFNCANHANVAT